jgi:hypothetical protein
MSETAKIAREKLLKFNPFREKRIDVQLPGPDGENAVQGVLVRQPTVATRDRILAEMQTARGDGKSVDGAGLARAQALAVVLCCLDPESRAPIFTEADIESLMESPSGSFVDVLANEAMSLMGAAQSSATKSPAG